MSMEAFVSFLKKLNQEGNRAALARLRRGLGKGSFAQEMYPYVVRFLPEKRFNDDAYFLVGSLFGLHPECCESGNMGTVFRMLKKEVEDQATERRFLRILESHRKELPNHLRSAVKLAKYNKPVIPVPYLRLLSDITNWSHPDRFVQLAWAREFYRASGKEKPGETSKY